MQCKYVEIGGKIDNVFRRNIITTSLNKTKTISQYNFSDTYSTIYKYDNKNQDIANIIAPFYIDLDVENLKDDFDKLKRDIMLLTRKLKTLFKLSDNNIQYYFSGSKGFHILIPYSVFGIKPCKDLNDKYKMLAIELKSYTITKSIDTRIYDTKRLFREVNTVNTKTDLYKVPISFVDIQEFSYEELIAYAKSPKEEYKVDASYIEAADIAFNNLIAELKERQKRSINYKVAKQMLSNKELLPCVKYILQNGAQKGGRNNTAMALASSLYQREPNDYEGILDTMKAWNIKKLDEPLSDNELENTVKSAYRNVQDGKRYGCAAFIDMGICIKGCPIRRK